METHSKRGHAPSAHRTVPGLWLIVAYKLSKGALQLLAGLTLALVLWTQPDGTLAWLHGVAAALRVHAAPHWAVQLAAAVLGTLTRRSAWVAVCALLADGVLTSVEGWSLRLGKAWGEWLVVGASGCPIPVELYELTRHMHVGRALVLAANVAIVTVLVRRRLRAHAVGAGVDLALQAAVEQERAEWHERRGERE